jgi:hypothetical protein
LWRWGGDFVYSEREVLTSEKERKQERNGFLKEILPLPASSLSDERLIY